MDDDSNDIFGLENMSGDEDESLSQHVVSDTESTSGITATTKQSNAITEMTDMRDTKSMNPESVITDQDQEEFVEKNEILLQIKFVQLVLVKLFLIFQKKKLFQTE